MAEPIFKIVSKSEWQAAMDAGEFLGAEIDIADGFIHFSNAQQVRETVAKHFAGRADLVLVRFDPQVFGEALKWEVSRGGDLFPHLYASLQPEQATRVDDLPLGEDGRHQFPVDLIGDGQ